jgi:hypothetical protein
MDELLAFTEWNATLNRVEGGEPVRAILEAAARMKGPSAEKAKASLTPPAFPEPLAYLWSWWLDLCAARPEGQHGLAALTYRDLHAWAALTGAEPTAWEVTVLLAIDRTYRTHVQTQPKAGS